MEQAFLTLEAFQKRFLPIAESFFIEHRKHATLIDASAAKIIDHLQEFTLRGGKRVRSALLYYGYLCFSDENLSDVLKATVACELMQSFLLIHDDIIDESDFRRGGKTIHKIFTEYCPNKNDHYGKSMATLVGNVAGYLGIKALSDINFSAEIKYRIVDLYAQICIDEAFGQAMDLSFCAYHELSEELIYNIYKYKTSRYTTEFPLICAALLAGKNDPILKMMQEIGSTLGIIFQTQDDILGIFGDSTITGKSVSSDLIQGKKTLLLWKAWENGNVTQREYLQKIYGNKNASEEEFSQVRQIIKETGSLDYAKTVIKNLIHKTEEKFHALDLRSEGKQFIVEIMDYLIQRND